ncbi:MAG TPA: ABC transporter ATP-binding protein, partial [Candidatus Polarisedimenticolaceae bacterium]|nr:ABC transporter ATP-binding protein [Candidatus Polarisedimenticolaceae bacterium]
WTAVISTLLSLGSIATPLFFKYVVDQLVAIANHQASAGAARSIVLVIAALAGLMLISSIFGFIRERLADRLSADLMVKLNQRVFEHMLTLSIDYYERTRVGETMTKINFAIFEFIFWLQGLTEGTLAQIIQLILATALLWYISPLIGPVVLVLIVAGVTIQAVRIYRSRHLRREARRQFERAGGHFNETISHIATIRSSVADRAPLLKYNDFLAEARRLTYLQNNIEQRGNFARDVVNNLAVLSGIAIIAWQSLKGRATPGDVVAVALYMQQITSNIGPLGRLLVTTSQVETSVERVIGLLETKATVSDAPGARKLQALRTLEFQHVSFNYPEKKHRVLHDVSFKLDAGQTLALVGPSGTGKTTVTKLMLRFYEPTEGTILINGEPIESFTGESIRSHIGMVMQDVALFNDSVEANLQLANPRATKVQVRAAAEQAHADQFIEKLPEKYGTLVGERGIKLSGGEKQRVAIARAILKQPDLIILDEATSALDSESERYVQAGLAELMEDRTAVVIAHRLSTVMRADQILVLRGGKIVEQGVHEDLAALPGGLYAKLFKLQTEGFIKA